ncbi:MAG TPA: XdhC family protein [Panacibacter sp.]|nr:XdhC family protein [Panacibacter sp.]HNP43647.1 XdhC family protein [Panacibacter sp.]
MKEIKSIIHAYDEACKQGKQTALATVVHVEGSSYRKPGARMLITEDGQLTGAISGGCLEGDALNKALFVMAQQKAMLVTYDTMEDDDAGFGVGLGCNGIIQVLIEPLDPGAAVSPITLLREAAAKREKAVAITLFSLDDRRGAQPGTCLLVKETGGVFGAAPLLQDLLLHDASEVFESRQAAFKSYISETRNISAFIEYLKPVVSVIIIGAGNDVLPVADMAQILGWDITVADGRPALAKKERFGSSCSVLVSKPEHVLEKIDIDDQTVFLLMTHNYHYDLAMMRALLKRNVAYIGSLGPAKKLDRMLEELRGEGMDITAEMLQKVFGPAGLDIGSETSEEIALSIVAEIKAALSRRNGASLKWRADSIHPKDQSFMSQVKIDN